MNIPISPRLLACAKLVRPGDRVADIGCDHGYLSIYLLKNGIARSCIAADIRQMPLQSAVRNAEKFGTQEKMQFFLSDGVQNIPRDFDCMVCAGMGGDTMISILQAAAWLQNPQYRLILQCQSKTPLLRRYLSDTGWRIARENLVRDGKFLYTVMEILWQPEYPRLTPAQTYLTPALSESGDPELAEYATWVVNGLKIATAHRSDPELTAILNNLENLPFFEGGEPMTTVGDILACLENFAPRALKMDWDNVGLNCCSLNTPVTKILVALDPFTHVCQEASDWGAQLLVTHHPLIFQPVPSVTDETTIGRSLQTLIRSNISHICLHTNLDCAIGGVNDVLAAKLGLENFTSLEETGNLIRRGHVPQQELPQFLQTVKERLGCQGLRYVDGGKPVRHVAVGGGSCAGALADVLAAGCDTLVTGDVKYNQFWDAKELGLNLIDAGHFHTENPVVAVLAQKIADAFPEITVKISETHADCMKFY